MMLSVAHDVVIGSRRPPQKHVLPSLLELQVQVDSAQTRVPFPSLSRCFSEVQPPSVRANLKSNYIGRLICIVFLEKRSRVHHGPWTCGMRGVDPERLGRAFCSALDLSRAIMDSEKAYLGR